MSERRIRWLCWLLGVATGQIVALIIIWTKQ